jgi:L-threonylcarbamoyladenylate synthase
MAKRGKDIQHAKRLLEQGELVAIPTETVYGLAANALEVTSVTKIFKAKNRPSFDPLIVHVADIEHAKDLALSMPGLALSLAEEFWPGPLTIVLPKRNTIPDLVTAGLNTVGLRCPNHPLTQSLLKELRFPLAAPSANPFGYVSPTSPDHVNEQLGDRVAYILDGGNCIIGIESTIIGFDGNAPVLLRRGGLSQEVIEDAIGPVQVRLHSHSNPIAPGQMDSHYAPKKKFILGDIYTLLKNGTHAQAGLLTFSDYYEGIPKENQVRLSPSGNLEEAAQNLFASLRALDKMNITTILAEEVPETGLGRAINDRLRRAAARA